MNLYDNKEDLKTIIVNASEYFSYVPAIIEKDYYSMMFLKKLIEYDNNIIFKGGTAYRKGVPGVPMNGSPV
jgi:predicted nucleotidyltransferase component of viral defense system